MAESENFYPNVNKAKYIVDKPFRLNPWSIRDDEIGGLQKLKTNYDYYKSVIRKNGGRAMEGFWKGDPLNRTLWLKPLGSKEPYAEVDPQLFEYQRPEDKYPRSYLEKRYTLKIDFLNPSPIPVWDKEQKREVEKDVHGVWFECSKAMYERICEEYSDPRTNYWDYILLELDNPNVPANYYKTSFYETGEPYDDAVVAEIKDKREESRQKNSGTKTGVYEHELPLIETVVGEKTTQEELVQYIMKMGPKKFDLASMTEERANQIADIVLVDGVVTLP